MRAEKIFPYSATHRPHTFMPQFAEEKLQRQVNTLRRKAEEENVKFLAHKYEITYVDLSVIAIEIDAIKIIPEEKARFGKLVIFQSAGKKIKVAVENPRKDETVAVLKRLEEDRYVCELFMASQSNIEYAWGFYKKVPLKHTLAAGTVSVSQEKLDELRQVITNLGDIKERIQETFFLKTTEALEVILAGALAVDVSDVHMEPQAEKVRLRFRIDGVLYDIIFLPTNLYKLLLSHIKLVSEMKLNVRDRAQDGRFTIRMHDTEIEVRTSVLPGPNGENVVLRILNPNSVQIGFENLGLQPWVAEIMRKEIERPNGMILTTGPTGSGKTTTLYTFLKTLYNPTIKVITLEDPIEYHLVGIEQTQVESEKGYDFANGLRSILRQDPDVILVGEIRDLETAGTAMHAALTGHLVFSTLHTNNAAGTIPRLLDLGVKPNIIAPAINVSMAQRLVRKLCASCKKALDLTKEIEGSIKKELESFPKGVPTPPRNGWSAYQHTEAGCEACNHTGYKGRIAVIEVILVDEGVEQLILKNPSEFEIIKESARQGQINMRQDGLLKMLSGITDLEELTRVIGT